MKRAMCCTFCFLLWHSVHDMTSLLRFFGGDLESAEENLSARRWPSSC